ncbi:MAG: SGNH/GDSL hydrolase family protein [Clostridiales bacterium]|nr:SGNH/GDSL hydrolase family protein [Clostridiales bacterium]
MRGPKAPKDPTKKREAIHLMIDRDIAGTPSPDGKITDINFMEGRMRDQIVGICDSIDEEILNMAEHVDTLLKLVHSIGVSFTARDEANKGETIDFTIHFYGKVDKYVTGSNITVDCPLNGEEVLIPLAECGLTDNDDIIGDFLFEFTGKERFAKVSLKFYLNDGYHVPEIEIDPPVDFTSPNYQKMLERAVINTGNTLRLKKAIEKAKKGEDITIAYIGGSITQGAGAKPINEMCYTYLSYKGFCDLFTGGDTTHVHYVKAGVGGTPSELGLVRYHKDVRDYGATEPDIVVIEFAVNDEGDETKGVCYESLIRMAAKSPKAPAVILNFAVFMNDWNLEERLVPVGKHYDLPMVSVKNVVVPQYSKDTVITKRQYFYDIYHPSNEGHKIMADSIIELFKKADGQPAPATDSDFSRKALLGSQFEDIFLIDRQNYKDYCDIETTGYDSEDKELQAVERNMDLSLTKVFENVWAKDATDHPASFTMKIKAKNIILVLKDSGSADFGTADLIVDGKTVKTIDPLEVGWNHCNPQIILDEETSADHTVEVKLKDNSKAFTILGFGVTI